MNNSKAREHYLKLVEKHGPFERRPRWRVSIPSVWLRDGSGTHPSPSSVGWTVLHTGEV